MSKDFKDRTKQKYIAECKNPPKPIRDLYASPHRAKTTKKE